MTAAQERRLERLLAVAEHHGTGPEEREVAISGARKVAAAAGLTDRYARRLGLAVPQREPIVTPAGFSFDDMNAAMRAAAEAAERLAADMRRMRERFPTSWPPAPQFASQEPWLQTTHLPNFTPDGNPITYGVPTTFGTERWY